MRKGGNFMKIRKKMAGTIAMIMALSLGIMQVVLL